ncbi:MAG TPA: 4Fe-4S binding protein [Candidatus Oscillibacter excrementigallinarum]|uniref:4Fe-4S binding protein n=1 Tax=Candidatus Oscillibacter excrementigallinarum TaxID=2838716 RepID=A0A9D2RRD1_9FIRM|nr:4Fe-4S binding protein [Candidatus Oscillibacter excrementigallinarum]
MNRVKIDAERCKACGYCIYFCPQKSILKQGENVNRKGYRCAEVEALADCIACGICATVCPEIAISVERDITEP